MTTLSYWSDQMQILENHMIKGAEIALALDNAIDELKKVDLATHAILKERADQMQKRVDEAFNEMCKTRQSP